MDRKAPGGPAGTAADRIAETLRTLSLDQSGLAAALETTPATVSRLLSGKQALSLALAERLATCAGVRAAWLLTGELPVRANQAKQAAVTAAYAAGWQAAVAAMAKQLVELRGGATPAGSPSRLDAAQRHRRELEDRGLLAPQTGRSKSRRKRA